jgi:hypothetical protein
VVPLDAESGCANDSEISAADVRQARTHITCTEKSTGTSAPAASIAVIVSPCHPVIPAAARPAGSRVYLVPPELISEIAGRLTGAWKSIRIQTRAVAAGEAEPDLGIPTCPRGTP